MMTEHSHTLQVTRTEFLVLQQPLTGTVLIQSVYSSLQNSHQAPQAGPSATNGEHLVGRQQAVLRKQLQLTKCL